MTPWPVKAPRVPSTLSTPPRLSFEHDALFLDFDGTLIDIADTPDGIVVPDSLIERLLALSERLDGRLAIVSGRSIETLEKYGLSGLTCAGSHGAEWRLAGAPVQAHDAPEGLDEAKQEFVRFANERDGILFEDKPLGAALHYRMAADESAPDASARLARGLADEYDMHLQEGHEMVELRAAGVDKGSAIRALMQQPPFADHRPVFLGDDVTDEAGFTAAAAAGGHGVLIGPERETKASYRLENPSDVNKWLLRSLDE